MRKWVRERERERDRDDITTGDFQNIFTYKACKDADKPIKSVVGTRRNEFPSKRKFCKLWRWLSVMLSKVSIALYSKCLWDNNIYIKMKFLLSFWTMNVYGMNWWWCNVMIIISCSRQPNAVLLMSLFFFFLLFFCLNERITLCRKYILNKYVKWKLLPCWLL